MTAHNSEEIADAHAATRPAPSSVADQVRRDNAVKALARAASLCTQLGGALEALKITQSRNDAELAPVRLQAVEILHRRLVDQFERPAFAAALALSSSPAEVAPRLTSDPPGEAPSTPSLGYDDTGVSR